jgi:hypothetical protein
MMKSKKRPVIVQTTLSEPEAIAFREQAEKEGATPTAFLRQLAIKAIQERRAESS